MNRKQRRHQPAAPQRRRRPQKYQKQKDRRCGVEQDVRQVVPPGMEPINSAVDLPGNRCHRRPTVELRVRKRPGEPIRLQASRDMRLGKNIDVVIVDESELPRLPENRPHQRRQDHADPGNLPPIALRQLRGAFFQDRAHSFRLRLGGNSGRLRLPRSRLLQWGFVSGLPLRLAAHAWKMRSSLRAGVGRSQPK